MSRLVAIVELRRTKAVGMANVPRREHCCIIRPQGRDRGGLFDDLDPRIIASQMRNIRSPFRFIANLLSQ